MSFGIPVKNGIGIGLASYPSLRANKPGGAAPAWTPADITTSLWLDANDSSTIVLNGSTVSQWSDKSGNNRNATQSTAANQPTYQSNAINNKPALLFDGSNDVMSTAAGTTGFYITLLRPNGLQSYGAQLGFNTKLGIIRNGITNNWYFSASSLFPSTNARVNSVLSTVLGTTTAIFSNEGTPLSIEVTIGDDNAGGAPAQCSVCEIVTLASSPSTDNRQKLEGYLAWKWGGI